jgi:hypothetical protein
MKKILLSFLFLIILVIPLSFCNASDYGFSTKEIGKDSVIFDIKSIEGVPMVVDRSTFNIKLESISDSSIHNSVRTGFGILRFDKLISGATYKATIYRNNVLGTNINFQTHPSGDLSIEDYPSDVTQDSARVKVSTLKGLSYSLALHDGSGKNVIKRQDVSSSEGIDYITFSNLNIDTSYVLNLVVNNNGLSYDLDNIKFTTDSNLDFIFSPTSGKEGTEVTITGKKYNITGTKSVIFGNVSATPKTNSDNVVVVVVPKRAQTGKIILMTNSDSLLSQNDFVVDGKPVVANTNASSTPPITGTVNRGSSKGLVPNCAPDCNFNDLITLVNKVISFLLFYLATPLAGIIFAWAGFIYITSGGDTSKIKKAKTMLTNVLVGYVIALAAWLIVKTILNILGVDPSIDTYLK